jgi:hypothetical protein
MLVGRLYKLCQTDSVIGWYVYNNKFICNLTINNKKEYKKLLPGESVLYLGYKTIIGNHKMNFLYKTNILSLQISEYYFNKDWKLI